MSKDKIFVPFFTFVVMTLVMLFACSQDRCHDSRSPIDQEEAESIKAALKMLRGEQENPESPESRYVIRGFAGSSLFFLEKGRLPRSYADALKGWSITDERHYNIYVKSALLRENREETERESRLRQENFINTCPNSEKGPGYAEEIWSTILQTEPSKQTEYIYRSCNFQRYKLVEYDEIPRVVHYTEVWFAFSIYNYLLDRGGTEALEQELIRAMMTGL